jgi:hypothetical protein
MRIARAKAPREENPPHMPANPLRESLTCLEARGLHPVGALAPTHVSLAGGNCFRSHQLGYGTGRAPLFNPLHESPGLVQGLGRYIHWVHSHRSSRHAPEPTHAELGATMLGYSIAPAWLSEPHEGSGATDGVK